MEINQSASSISPEFKPSNPATGDGGGVDGESKITRTEIHKTGEETRMLHLVEKVSFNMAEKLIRERLSGQVACRSCLISSADHRSEDLCGAGCSYLPRTTSANVMAVMILTSLVNHGSFNLHGVPTS